MPRPFAVAGFTVFFTLALLSDCETGVMIFAFGAYIVALVIALLIRSFRKGRVIPFSMASGALACVLLICFNVFTYEPIISYDGQTAHITAELCGYPEERYGNTYYQAKVLSIDGVETDLHVRLTFNTNPDAEPYDMVEGDFTFYLPGYTAEEYLEANKAKGIYLGAYPAFGADETVISVDEADKPFMYKIGTLRSEIKNSLYRVMPNEYGALANALLLGDKSNLTDETLRDFQNSGITHIICVSGFHLSLWANFILTFLKKLGVNIKVSSLFAIVGVVFFMFISGLTASVLRSGIMTVVYLLGNMLSRKRDSLNSLGFALFVLAFYNPMILTGISLQLSALSTLGIIVYNETLSPKITEFCSKIRNEELSKIADKILQALCVTASAVAFIQPVALKVQGGFNFLVFASNLLVTYVAGVCMVLCALAAAIGTLLPLKYNVLANLGTAAAKYIMFVADAVSEITFLNFRIDEDKSYLLLSGLMILCSVSIYLIYVRKPRSLLSIILCITVFTSGIVFTSVRENNETRITVFDVGNGTAVMLAHKDKNILFGCGGTTFSAYREIGDYLYRNGGDIDALILPDVSGKSSEYSVNILKSYRPETVQCDALSKEASLLVSGERFVPLSETLTLDGITVKNEKIGKKICTFVRTQDISALICYDPIDTYSEIPGEFADADVLIARSDYPDGAEISGFDFVVVNAENLRGVLIQDELLSLGVNCAATAECGNITIRADDGDIYAYRS